RPRDVGVNRALESGELVARDDGAGRRRGGPRDDMDEGRRAAAVHDEAEDVGPRGERADDLAPHEHEPELGDAEAPRMIADVTLELHVGRPHAEALPRVVDQRAHLEIEDALPRL